MDALTFHKFTFSKDTRLLREATTIGYLFRIYPNRVNSFSQWSQKWGDPIFWILTTFYLITAMFYRISKWSVWSIGICFCETELKCVIPKRSYGGKVKLWGGRKKSKFSFEVSNLIFWMLFQHQHDTKQCSKSIRHHSGLISIWNYILFV